jgi:hypothetical protein
MGFGMAGTGNIVNLKPIKKGERRVGRKPGTPNKTTQILKDALLDAATAVGFPMEVTTRHPKPTTSELFPSGTRVGTLH